MTACPVVIFDACVLYPSTLRNLLMWLALTDLFRARWTHDIHEEWIKSVLADFPDIDPAALLRTRRLMDENVRDALVTDYEPLIESLSLPDPGDRHVLAAAIKAGAETIVTSNLRDFPQDILRRTGSRRCIQTTSSFVYSIWIRTKHTTPRTSIARV